MSMRTINREKRSEWFFGYLFITPIALGLVLFYLWPVIHCLFISFTDWDGMGAPLWIGLGNYVKLFSRKETVQELINTFTYTFATVPISIGLSVVLACILNSKLIRFKSAYKIIYFLPSVTMAAAISLVWRWLFNSKFGLINQALSLFGIQGPMWLADVHWLMPSLVIIGIWNSLGYNMILVLSGLQGIPRTYYESAEIDGASAVRQFFHITIPLLSPTIFFVATMAFIGAFKAFDSIFIFADKTAGVLLDAIKTLVYGIYQEGFKYSNMGFASSKAVVLCIIIIIFTSLQFWLQKKWVHYE